MPSTSVREPTTVFPILSLPTELCCSIISEIDSPGDLLHLALTTRCFRDIIIPDHLEYRKITNNLLGRPLWLHFIQNPVFSENVRELNVRLSTHYKVPGGFIVHKLPQSVVEMEAAFLDSRADLCKAFRRMSRLRAFRWSLTERCPDENDAIWDALAEYCPNLSEVLVEDYGRRSPGHDIRMFHDWKLFDLKNLTTIKLHSIAYRSLPGAPPDAVSRLRSFLLSSAALESLDFMFMYADLENSSTPFDDILSSASWPHLKHLSLALVSCEPAIVASFLARHSSLESFRLRHDYYGLFNLSRVPSGALPRLALFEGAYASILQLARVTPAPPLEVVKFECKYEEEYVSLARVLKAFMGTLRWLDVPSIDAQEGAGWQRVCEALPEVTVRDHRTSRCLKKLTQGGWALSLSAW
ncbi:hypothetical protein NEOLEDRAFT_1148893 [Neolentinus lepideus HHB14362 ss-1]|uniref:F-box domain-containing protein n=1 Tax=Neolentinus lepideus HHB14362 ss-1 TaxID=1314782 RepID=A0A165RMH6_9AGAM|nr:hypothetical protein NEOLEDRAFT_1148893 [Neolentinus lepideus HHB14362 ss-1]